MAQHSMVRCTSGVVQLMASPFDFVCETLTDLVLPELAGPSLRGALLEGMYTRFCANLAAPTCRDCPLHRACPVSRFVATIRDAGVRGSDIPRPFALRPPLGLPPRLRAGQEMRFGLTILGPANYLPYLLQALQDVGKTGVGLRTEAPGRFRIREIWSMNHLQGSGTRVWDSSKRPPDVPTGPVTHQMIMGRTAQMAEAPIIYIRLLTPTRLIEDGHLVRTFSLEALLRRILRRLSDLQAELYSTPLDLDYAAILAAGAKTQVTHDGTRWVDAMSHSNRTGHTSPIGGLVGAVAISGALREILPWLLWGEAVGVGKDVTKGNGWLRVEVGYQ